MVIFYSSIISKIILSKSIDDYSIDTWFKIYTHQNIQNIHGMKNMCSCSQVYDITLSGRYILRWNLTNDYLENTLYTIRLSSLSTTLLLNMKFFISQWRVFLSFLFHKASMKHYRETIIQLCSREIRPKDLVLRTSLTNWYCVKSILSKPL